MAGLKDAILQLDYRADIGWLYLGQELISDNFCNMDTWEVGLMEHMEALKTQKPVLKLAPIREGARVNVESAMAARNESVKALVAELRGARIRPVYEVRLQPEL